MNLFWTFGRSPWTADRPDVTTLPTQENTTQKKRGNTSMPRTGFEPTIPMFERSKTVRVPQTAWPLEPATKFNIPIKLTV